MTSVETAAVRASTRESAATTTLLARLASDDAFRADFERRPREVLRALGLAADALPDGPVRLPAKDDLRALLADAVARRSCIETEDPIVFSHAP